MSVYVRLDCTSREPERVMELLDYVNKENKTNKSLCHTSNMSIDNAYRDMIFLKTLYRKTEGRQILHWVLSHDGGVSAEQTDRVAQEVLELLADKYQVYAATHINTDNCHTHFLINPIDIKNGKKFSESRDDMLKFRDSINEILKEKGLNEIGVLQKISKEEWDATSGEERIAEKQSECDEYTEKDESEYYWIEEYEDDYYWSGKGIVEGATVFAPGIMYQNRYETASDEKIDVNIEDRLIPGVTYDNADDFDVIQCFDGKYYVGKARVENNIFFGPGILREIEL